MIFVIDLPSRDSRAMILDFILSSLASTSTKYYLESSCLKTSLLSHSFISHSLLVLIGVNLRLREFVDILLLASLASWCSLSCLPLPSSYAVIPWTIAWLTLTRILEPLLHQNAPVVCIYFNEYTVNRCLLLEGPISYDFSLALFDNLTRS